MLALKSGKNLDWTHLRTVSSTWQITLQHFLLLPLLRGSIILSVIVAKRTAILRKVAWLQMLFTIVLLPRCPRLSLRRLPCMALRTNRSLTMNTRIHMWTLTLLLSLVARTIFLNVIRSAIRKEELGTRIEDCALSLSILLDSAIVWIMLTTSGNSISLRRHFFRFFNA